MSEGGTETHGLPATMMHFHGFGEFPIFERSDLYDSKKTETRE